MSGGGPPSIPRHFSCQNRSRQEDGAGEKLRQKCASCESIRVEHPRGQPFGGPSVPERKAAQILLGVSVVLIVIPKVSQEIFKEPIPELLRCKPDQGRVLIDRR